MIDEPNRAAERPPYLPAATSASAVLRYVLLTYLLSWAFFGPFVYLWRVPLEREFALWLLIFLPGAYGPSLAALLLAWRDGGGPAVRALLGELKRWRVATRWYAVAVLLPLLISATALALAGVLPQALSAVDWGRAVGMAPLVLLLALPFGPMGEELGWRGYLLPLLRRRHGILLSSAIVGVVWTFWHLPMFWFPGAAIPAFLELSATAVLLYLAQIGGEAFLFTFLAERSRHCVPLAILFHLFFNTANSLLLVGLPDLEKATEIRVYGLEIAMIWVAVVAWWLLGFARAERSAPRPQG